MLRNKGEMIMAKYKAFDIAEWFLLYNNYIMGESDADLITNLKLQKLLYYAQGCYLAITDEPLFDENILAWEHGPVVEEVYQKYKKYRSNGILFDGDYKNIIEKDDEEILIEVYNIFAKYSAWGLRNLTHAETPWKETPKNGIISLESINTYFKENYIS